MREDQGAGEDCQAARLVGGGQVDGDEPEEGADPEGCLHDHEVDEAGGALSDVVGEGGLDAAGAGVGEEGEGGAEGGGGEDAVVELDEAGVLEHVAPPEVGVVLLAAVELVPELGLGRGQAETHHGELVVDETGVETGDETARHACEEDEASHAEDRAAEGLQGWVLNSLDNLHSGLGVGEEAAGAEDGDTRDEHPGVADEGGSQVSSEAVLRNTGVRPGSEQIILETRLYHPPSNDALETDESRDTREIPGHFGSHSAAGDEVGGRDNEREANEATPDTVGPFHEVDLLEFFEVHVGVEKLELGRGTVLFELGFPVLKGHGGQ